MMGNVVCGYKAVPVTVNDATMGPVSGQVGMTYVRIDRDIVILEYWFNPAVATQMGPFIKMLLEQQARTRLFDMLTMQLDRHPDHERGWDGVLYG
jgi:hypothetical protein